jgi:proteic killer suppression protein
MIRSFKCKDTLKLFKDKRVKRFNRFSESAKKKLLLLDSAMTLLDLSKFPGLRLERLKGNRRNQHSIRINDQWRICFTWQSDGPYDIEIIDYH